MTSVAAALALLLGAIPRVIGFAVILIIGWIIASALATAVAAILRTVKFNELAQRAGISGFVQKMGLHIDAAGFLATLVKWFVRLSILVTAFDALGLPAVSQVLQQQQKSTATTNFTSGRMSCGQMNRRRRQAS